MASFQDRAQHAVAQLDKELSKYPVLNNFERQTNVPKVYVILGLVGVYFFLVFFNIAGEFLVNFAGFLLPGYYSLQALFTSVAYSFYYIFKFVLILWMALPQTSGAQVVFHSFLQPLVGRFFSQSGTSANLRAQAEAAKAHSS
ncbi:Protein yop1 [Penicillium subrubescens]|uniref:Protein yop1 n=1 Tax=Penicillium subrubescens TaxID=1316194 RepID=A0A1Q5UB79_9EURO|nr:Protein yop1 [Penicillium subrubescens]